MTTTFESLTEQFESVREYVQKAPAGLGILNACLDFAEFLIKKNISYGNSALEPLNVLSNATAEEQIRMHIDNKLTRLKNQKEFENEDSLLDLTGYLILLTVLKKSS